MKLEGSCHCGAVRFSLASHHPAPFNLCYCSICRKTQGGGGYAINLGGEAQSLKVEGEEHLTIYRVKDKASGEDSPLRRHFCKHCGSSLWCWDERWPELIHPFASAIDTPLPMAPERVHLMVGSKAAWVPLLTEENDKTFEAYPEESIADWHKRLGLEVE